MRTGGLSGTASAPDAVARRGVAWHQRPVPGHYGNTDLFARLQMPGPVPGICRFGCP